jgi:hypothetical protein
MRTRDEHLALCKQRALAYVAVGQLQDALNSMMSDLTKHPETKDHEGISLCIALELIGALSTRQDVEKFINGFN